MNQESSFDENAATSAEENIEEQHEELGIQADAAAQSEPQPEAEPEAETESKPAPKARTATTGSPSGDQLWATRAARWHQDGQPLLTLETMREWLQRSGLVLYAPRAQQLGAPAASWVEATLGNAESAPEIAATDHARTLLARLIAEGAAVPLNLLGATGGMGADVPDFVASAAVFSYIFTLHGNKAWKQAPVTSGPLKVSPLALATYEILAAKVMMSAYDLATQLGKEVTEGAVLRSLNELWSQLRVIPVPQLDGSATLWELASSRFTKQIKAGANAGQPSALSALISLYLGQAVAAEESEIESFLSPLAARSRVREVIHALVAARQLETLVIKGKTLLHVAGDLPQFAAAQPEPAATPATEHEEGSRISRMAARPASKLGTGLRAKPTFGKKPFGAKPAFGREDRERRPFKRASVEGSDRPARPARPERPRFDKPWDETAKPRFERSERPRPDAGFQAGADDSRPPRREFPPREDGPRRTFSKPGTFGRKREAGGRPEFRRSRDGDDARPPRREFGDRPAGGGFKRPGSFSPRPRDGEAPRERGGFAGKPSFGPKRDFGGKPAFGPKRDFGGKPAFGAKPFRRERPEGAEGGEAPRRTFRKFDAPRSPKPFGKPAGGKFAGPRGERSERSERPDRPERPRRDFEGGGERPRRSFDSARPSGGGFAGKSDGAKKPFGQKPYGKPGGFARPGGFAKPGGARPGGSRPGGAGPGGRPGGSFNKFAGKKPFGKPGAKPSRSRDGGYTPTPRKRPEEGESA